MKVLAYHCSLGIGAVFLPPRKGEVPPSAVVPDSNAQVRPAFAQVAAQGRKASWNQHCQVLVESAPYAGRWSVEEVPDGMTPQEALRRVREQEADKNLT